MNSEKENYTKLEQRYIRYIRLIPNKLILNFNLTNFSLSYYNLNLIIFLMVYTKRKINSDILDKKLIYTIKFIY